MSSSTESSLTGLSGRTTAILGGITGGIGPAVGGALAGIPVLFAGIGIAAAAQNAQVKTAFTDMKNHVVTQTQQLAAPLVPVLTGVATQVRSTFDQIAPAVGQAFQ